MRSLVPLPLHMIKTDYVHEHDKQSYKDSYTTETTTQQSQTKTLQYSSTLTNN